VKGGALQLSLLDERAMASITSQDFPGERLIVCRNRDLAAKRTRKRKELLAAIEPDLARIRPPHANASRCVASSTSCWPWAA
jgi:hypothetical protein